MRGWQIAVVVALVTVVVLVLGTRALLQGRRVPTKAKLVIAGAIVWLLSPIDLISDVAFPVGFIDDVAVLIAAVRYVLDQLQPPEQGGTRADRRSIDRRLDQRDAVEPDDWRFTGDGKRPGSS